MANYTISTYTATATTSTDLSPSLTITPDDGYVVRANDFSIGGGVTRGTGANINKWTYNSPTNITSVTFVDTDPNYISGLGYSESNTVQANIELVSNFESSLTADQNISIDIDGEAKVYSDVALSVPVNFELLSSLTGLSFSFSNISAGLSLSGNNLSGNIGFDQEDDYAPLADITFTPNEDQLTAGQDSGNSSTGILDGIGMDEEGVSEESDDTDNSYQHPLFPFLTYTDASQYVLTPKSVGNNPTEEHANQLSFRLSLNTRKSPVDDRKVSYRLKGKAVSPLAVPSTKEITAVDFGDTTISVNGEERVMKVFGDVGAVFSLNVCTDIGTIGTLDGSESGDILSLTNVVIPNNSSRTRGQGVYSFTVHFPFASTTKNYGLNIDAGAGSSLGSGITRGANAVYDYKFQQYVNPTVTINAVSDGATYASQLSTKTITREGVANKQGSYLKGVKNRSGLIPIRWEFTTTSKQFGVKSIIDQDDFFIGSNGDFSSALNNSSNWTHTSTIAERVASSEYGNYIHRASGKTDDLVISQDCLTVGRSYTFTITYSGASNSNDSLSIKAGSGDPSAATNYTVEQSSIGVHKTLTITRTATTNGTLEVKLHQTTAGSVSDVKIHSITNSNVSNTQSSENGGSVFSFANASTTVDNSGTNRKAYVNADLNIIRYGNANVTLDIDLSQIISES